MALSKLPLNSRAPVRKRLPTLAEVKSKVDEGGRARLRISRFSKLKNERINSFFAGVMDFQSSEVPSTIDCHAPWAATASEGSRWLNRVLIAARSEFGGESGIRRTSLPVCTVSNKDWRLFEQEAPQSPLSSCGRYVSYFSHHRCQDRQIFGSAQRKSLHCH